MTGRRVVISQSMYFPWVGMLEQIRLADTLIHYDDVQFSKGSFSNRVQVKLPNGPSWMTVPLHDHHMGQTIEEVQLQPTGTWRARHLAMLEQSFAGAPHAADALELAGRVINGNHATLADLARDSMLSLCSYFGLDKTTRFADAGDFAIGGSGSVRVLELVKAVGGTDYITGHGARTTSITGCLRPRVSASLTWITNARPTRNHMAPSLPLCRLWIWWPIAAEAD
jgi:hypothetical protein